MSRTFSQATATATAPGRQTSNDRRRILAAVEAREFSWAIRRDPDVLALLTR